jgi:hypothetical protein
MTVSSETNKITYAGDGATASFSTSFTFAANGEVTVTLVDSAGAETEWTEGTEYTLAGANTGNAGTVTVDTSPTDYTPASGETLVIQLKPDYTQTTDLPRGGTVSPADTLEPMHDSRVRQILRLKDDVDRSVKVPISETTPGATLPLAATRANKVLAFDASGYPTVSTSTISAIESGATDAAASAAAASTSETNAATSESNASASATLASQWATKTDGQVASTDYASKAWAIGGTGVTDTASAGAAKEWATEAEDNTVDGTEYSAKHYSAKASAQATAAAASAAAAATAAASNLYSTVTTLTTGTTDVEITNDGTYYICDTSGGNITINLPAIGTDEGIRFGFQKSSASNTVTFVRDGTDTINGGTSYTLTEDTEVVLFIADDASPDNWVATIQSQTLADEITLTKTGSQFSIKDNGVTPAKVSGSVNAQTGTTYTLILGDAFKQITMSNNSANTLTIPTNASVAFSTGDRIDVWMLGAGVTTITGDTGVTVNGVSAGSGDLAQYGACSLLKIDTNTWLAGGITVA